MILPHHHSSKSSIRNWSWILQDRCHASHDNRYKQLGSGDGCHEHYKKLTWFWRKIVTEAALITMCNGNCDGRCPFVMEVEVHGVWVKIVTKNLNIVTDKSVTTYFYVSDCDESITICYRVWRIVTGLSQSLEIFFGFLYYNPWTKWKRSAAFFSSLLSPIRTPSLLPIKSHRPFHTFRPPASV